jgi:hypothetical protein
VGKVDGLGVDAERGVGGGFRHRPTVPAVITYPGGGPLDVSVFLVAGGGQGSIPAMTEAR